MRSTTGKAVAIALLVLAGLVLGLERPASFDGDPSGATQTEVVAHLSAPPIAHLVSSVSRPRPDHRLPQLLWTLLVVLLAVAATATAVEAQPSRPRSLLRWHGTTLRGPPAL